MTDFNKLADAMEDIADCNSTLYDEQREPIREAARILRTADGADMAGLMELASTLEYIAFDDGSNGKGDTPECDAARAALESALRMALASQSVAAQEQKT